jgi:hypothetical protein
MPYTSIVLPNKRHVFRSKPNCNLPERNAMPAKIYTKEKTEPDRRKKDFIYFYIPGKGKNIIAKRNE